jgi:hypothetical protein
MRDRSKLKVGGDDNGVIKEKLIVAAMSSPATYAEVIEKDIELTWAIQHYVHSNPSVRDWCRRLVSVNPLQDICSVIWIFAIVGVIEMGMKHFWVVLLNLFACFVMRKLLQVRRPVEYDIRLQPQTDRAAESFSVPSTESYMAVVILGHFVIHFNSFIFLPIAAAITFVVGFSRVYSKARFAHHIVVSWILGLVGLNLAHKYCEHINIHLVERSLHGYYGSIAGVLLICNFALNMENNDSRLVGVAKEDFVKVIRNIMFGSSERDDTGTEDLDGDTISASDGDLGVNRGDASSRPGTPRDFAPADTPRAAAARHRASREREESSRGKAMGVTKRDSFYFLQKTLMRRADAVRGGGLGLGSSNSVDSTPSTPRGYAAT